MDKEIELPRIVHIEDDETSINYKWREGGDHLELEKKGIKICSVENDLPQIKDKCLFYPSLHSPIIGDTYAKDPFGSNTLIYIDSLEEYILEKKVACISNIVKSLGASHFSYNLSISKSNKEENNADANAGFKSFSGDVKMAKKTDGDLTNKFKNDYKYESVLNENSYKKAIELAKQYNLYGDPMINDSLIAQRNPSEQSLLKEFNQSIDLSQELNESLDVAANLKLKFFKFSGDFIETINYKYKMSLNMQIEF